MPPFFGEKKRTKYHRRSKLRSPKTLMKEALPGGEEMMELLLDRGVLTIDPESFEARDGLERTVQCGMTGVVRRLLE
jgi:hypothetical protein